MKSETDLAEKVVEWLQAQQWEVFQEVQLDSFGRIADIVAVSGPLLWVIECKTSQSFAVFEQAFQWKMYANYIRHMVRERYDWLPNFAEEMADAEIMLEQLKYMVPESRTAIEAEKKKKLELLAKMFGGEYKPDGAPTAP